MKKKEIHIFFVYPKIEDVNNLEKLLLLDGVEDLPYKLVWDDKTPQFVIASELIYTDPLMKRKFETLYRENAVTIFMAGECVLPDLNLFDYGVSFDDLGGNNRLAIWPLRKFYREYIGRRENELEGSLELARRELEQKTGFCNFVYSNSNGHKNRDRIFQMLQTYKRVDSLGAHLNNTGFSDVQVNQMADRIRKSVDIKSHYKFTIAFENAFQAGYTTEKIFTTLEAHSIPVYWGNPDVGKLVNEDAFINCHKYPDFESVLERVKEIDLNDDLWCEMVSRPWMTKEQQENEKKTEKKYFEFLNRIFMSEYPEIKKKRERHIS